MSLLSSRLSLALVVGLAFCAYVSYPIVRAISIDKKLMKGTVPFEQHPVHPTLMILVAGDSTGVGTGTGRPHESTAGRLGAQYPSADVVNISENGLKIAGLEERLRALPAQQFDLILIQIGANDTIRFTSKEEIRRGLRSVLALAEEKAKRTIILTSGNIGLAPIFRWPLSSIYSQRTRGVREIFMEEVGKYKEVSFVDLFKEAADDVLSKDIDRYYASDGLHLTGDGYGVWFEEIKKVL